MKHSRTINRIILYTLSYLLFSCGVPSMIKKQKLFKQGTSETIGKTFRIPFEYTNGHMVVHVTIQGKKYPFVFDTGFPFCAIDSTLADELALPKHKFFETWTKVATFSIEDKPFKEFPLVNLNLKKYSSEKYRGILGNNLFRKWDVLQIDYQNRELLFTNDYDVLNIDSSHHQGEGVFFDYHFLLVASLNGSKIWWILDTGNSGRSMMSSSTAKRLYKV